MSYLELLPMIQRRAADLTARAEATAALSATGECSSTGIELDLIQGEVEFLTVISRELLAERRADVQALREG